MKMLVNVILPIEPFNSLVRSGKASEILGRIIDDIKPETIYFTEIEGNRGAVMIVEVTDVAQIPAISEPWFLNFEAACEFKPVMTPDDLMRADIAKLAAKWYDVHVL
ncbi:panthothenate synthetase [Flavobacterium suncheonense]|uniref:panthothenate synthetase n=1 Tax=Flavobacterium suncheonense TaxID=350894 RepID=UPI003FA37513